MKKRLLAVLLLLGIVMALCACQRELNEEESALLSGTTDISGIVIPEGVKVVGLGESTHGTREYHAMRRDVFQHLLETYGCHTFILEAAYGSCLKINEYILGKTDTTKAKDVLKYLEFWIYHTDEFETLLQWMHDYNQQAPEEEKIHFYGTDMQESVNTRDYLLAYMSRVSPSEAAVYEEQLSFLAEPVDPDIGIKEEDTALTLLALEQIADDMEAYKEKYIQATGRYEYELALECVSALKEHTTLLPMMLANNSLDEETNKQYSILRDQYMTNRVERIREMDRADMVFVTAHNMHMAREVLTNVDSSRGEMMGQLLSEQWGDAYFAIGTAFCEGSFTAIGYPDRNFRRFSVKETNSFICLFENLPGNSWYVDLSHLAKEPLLSGYLAQKELVLDVGSMYSRELDTGDDVPEVLSPRHPIVFQNAWDGMLVFKKTQATLIQQVH